MQAVFQPISQKAILLKLFILLKHFVIGVLVTGGYLAMGLEAADLHHTGVVISAHFHPQTTQPTAVRMLLVDMENGGIAAALHHLDTDTRITDHQLPGIAVFVIWKQAQQASIVGLAYGMQLC